MIITKTKLHIFLFVIALLLQIYLPSFRTNILLQFSILVVFFSFEKLTVSKQFFKIVVPIVMIFFIAFIGFFINRYNLVNVLKDIFHIIKPVLGLSIGYFIFKKINNFKVFVKTIVVCGLISALIHFSLLFITGNIFSGSVNLIREAYKDSFLELFALFFLLYYKKHQGENLFSKTNTFLFVKYILLLSCILYFSRTMIVAAIILIFSIKGYTIVTIKTIKVIGALLLTISVFYVYLYSVRIDRNKPGIESFLYKIKIAPEEIFKTKIDRENHKDLWDHWRGYEAKSAFELMSENPSSYIFGCGHGSLVNLKFYAPLRGPKDKGMKYISELHNGYPYILYKTGILGLILYFIFLFRTYKLVYKKNSFKNKLISAIAIYFFFSTITITGIYNFGDVVIFILGGLISFSEKEI